MSDVSSKKHDAPRMWDPPAAFLITGLIFILSQFFSAILLGIGMAVANNSASADAWLRSTAGQFIFVVLFQAITVGLLWFFLRIRKLGWRAIGFTRAPDVRDLGYLLGGFVVYFGLLIAISSLATGLFSLDGDQQQDTGFNAVFGSGQLLMVFVSLVVLPPIIEEILFRGFLFSGLRTKLHFWWAAIITSLSFGALHLLTGVEDEGLLWIAALDTFVLSLVLCYVRDKTGALWACIGIHALKNGLAFLYLFVVQ